MFIQKQRNKTFHFKLVESFTPKFCNLTACELTFFAFFHKPKTNQHELILRDFEGNCKHVQIVAATSDCFCCEHCILELGWIFALCEIVRLLLT